MAVAQLRGVVQGEWGQVLTLQCKHPITGAVVDISNYAGTKTVRVRSPQGANVVSATAAFATDGTDGKVTFSFIANNIDRSGTWTGTLELSPVTDTEMAKSYLFEMHVEEAV